MTRKILIEADNIKVEAKLNNSVTADKVLENLPITGIGNLWGDEVYFTTDISSILDDTSKLVVELGDIGYWPPSKALCIFYGKTPYSTDTEIRAASAVNVIGKVTSGLQRLKGLTDQCQITITKLD